MTDLCPTTSPHPAHRRDLGPFGTKQCPGVADAAPHDAGDAPTTSRPLPTHGDLAAAQLLAAVLGSPPARAQDDLPAVVFNAISRALQDLWPISVPLPVVRERCTAAVLKALDGEADPATTEG